MKKIFNFLFGAMLGGLIGAGTALLLTPSSGEALRGQIGDRFAALQDELSQAASERRLELENYLSSLREPDAGIRLEK
jgi:gas vesicle protein